MLWVFCVDEYASHSNGAESWPLLWQQMWSSPLEYLETNRRNEVEDNERIKTEFNEQKIKNKIKSRPNFQMCKGFFYFCCCWSAQFFLYTRGVQYSTAQHLKHMCARARVWLCASIHECAFSFHLVTCCQYNRCRHQRCYFWKLTLDES